MSTLATPSATGGRSARPYQLRGLLPPALLDARVRAVPRGADDDSAWERARALWVDARGRVATMDRAGLERAWVQPVLVEVLGWKVAGEPATAEPHRPRWRLLAGGEPAAVADAAAWAQPLDEGDASVAAPSFRAAASLAAAAAPWAILTNGREWRLYSPRDGIATFLSIDLHRLLEAGDEDGFRAFRFCFAAASFARGGAMESLRDEAAARADEAERRLKAVVLEDVFQRLARGFIDGRRRRGIVDAGEGALHDVEDATARLLFRLLVVLHAEARGLLPAGGARYEAVGLARLRERVAGLRDAGQPLSPASHEAWEALQPLWDALSRGDAALGVPRFGGALFGDEAGDRFLRENPVSDFFLVHALDHLSRDGERRFVDFAELPVEHLGALRAALREHRLTVDEAGKPVLAGERRAAAPSPAPAWLVDHVIAQAVGPALDERAAAFRAAAEDAAWRRDRLASASSEEREREEREIAELEDAAVDALLSLRVADPAMGGGRFLLRAAETVSRRVAVLAAELPANPLARRLSAARDELDAGASAVDRADLGDALLLTRMVARRCVFGVDRDPVSVDLAKLSLQLAAHLPGAPPLFLDPHLKPGDALVGTRVAEVERALEEDPRGQFDAFSGPFRGLPRALEPARGFARAPEADAEARFAELEREAAPYRRLLDAWVSRAFGNRLGAELVSVHAPRVLEAARGMAGSFGAAHRDALAAAERLSAEHRFFHWDLEFPEVFAAEGEAGFDAVVGAPPSARPEQAAALRPYLAGAFAEVHDGSAELSVYFFRQGVALLRRGGRLAFLGGSRWLRASHAEALRRWLAERAETEALADLGPAGAEGEGASCVVVVRRPERDGFPDRLGEARVAHVPRDVPGDAFAAYVAENSYGVPRARFGAAPWSLEPRAVEALMEKLRGAGVPLREYAGAAPLYGLRAGPAEAFVVDEETRQRLLAHDPAAASLLHPFLRAQDVERWAPAWAGLWLIALRSGENHPWPWTGAPADRAERVFAQTFPGVHAHLKPHEDRLRARAEQGQHWWELRGCGYYDAFEAPKLVWRDLSFHSAFCVDVDGLYTHDLCFVLPTEDRWLAAVLNSPLMWFFMWRTVVHGKDEVLRLKNVYMETLPVVHPTAALRAEAGQSVDRLVELTREKRGLEREMAEWLRVEYGVAQPGERLEAFADVSAGDFVEEVKRRRPKKAEPLAPREVGLLRNAHAEYAPRLTAVQAKIAGLERKLSQMVNRAYGLTAEEVELMWSTAPPRMPVGR